MKFLVLAALLTGTALADAPATSENKAAREADIHFGKWKRVHLGVFLGANLFSRDVGIGIFGDAGVNYFGFIAFDRKWLLAWTGDAAFRGGILGSTLPVAAFYGGRLQGRVEGIRRFCSERLWSFYLGLMVDAGGMALVYPAVGWNGLNTVNASDGVGGGTGNGFARIGLGASQLTGSRSMLIGVFAQEYVRSGGVVTREAAITEFGGYFRLDIRAGHSVTAEVFGGFASPTSDTALGRSTQLFRIQGAGWYRRDLPNNLWVSVGASVGQERYRIEYRDLKYATDVGRAVTATVFVNVGYAFWSSR